MSKANIVLAGGGYANLLTIRRFGLKPVHNVRMTLISPLKKLPYTGMVPGYIAGSYTYDQIHIDVERLCQWAGVSLIHDEVCSLDPARQVVRLKQADDLHYTLLSLNTGPMADTGIRGADELAKHSNGKKDLL